MVPAFLLRGPSHIWFNYFWGIDDRRVKLLVLNDHNSSYTQLKRKISKLCTHAEDATPIIFNCRVLELPKTIDQWRYDYLYFKTWPLYWCNQILICFISLGEIRSALFGHVLLATTQSLAFGEKFLAVESNYPHAFWKLIILKFHFYFKSIEHKWNKNKLLSLVLWKKRQENLCGAVRMVF